MVCVSASAQNPVTVRMLFGVTATRTERWDGTIEARGGKINSIEPWRFDGADAISGSMWHLSTHAIRLFGGGTQFTASGINNFVPNGLIVNFSVPDENAELRLTTAQGDLEVRLSEVGYGKPVARLGGRVLVDRIPPTTRITDRPDEEDYPAAAAGKGGEVWLAYLQFRHHPDHNKLRANLQTPLKDFSKLKAPPGGDQIFMRRYSAGAWGKPMAVSEPGGDLYRPAVAVDGQGQVWVFWSQNLRSQNGRENFELFGRAVVNGTPGAKVQISNDPGSDIDPVAATDREGKVWVAWQGWRNGRAVIFAAVQEGNKFPSPVAVSQSSGNEWNPAIAADGGGRVTVAWDSYRNGNYDVYLRTVSSGTWGSETPVAASARYEAYPSIAYDNSGRLWVAYEEGGQGWGKDFGAYNTTGVSVYQGRVIRLRGFEPGGQAVEVPGDLSTVLPGAPNIHLDKAGQQDFEALDPDPNLAKGRETDRPARNMENAKNSYPRLLVDGSGRIWLAFRSAHPIWWSPVGTVWTEHLVSFDGKSWTPPIYLNHTDNLLDNRPALISTAPGRLLVLGSSDNRREFHTLESGGEDPYNNDLYANEIDLGPASQPPAVVAAHPATPAGPESVDKVDSTLIQEFREYRADLQGGLRIVRGEFHRHSEISMDGGFDGSLLDQYRYIIDAAALDWVGCCDHDNGGGREYSWWISQKLTDIFYAPGRFVPMFNYERSVVYPEGHRNVIFAQRGVRTLPRLPLTKENQPGRAPDTQMLYAYLKFFNGATASHTSATGMGTDWRDNDPEREPVVEIYQGDRQNYEIPDGPRANSEKDSIGGWRPKGFVSLALAKGYKLGFQASSDHVSTHMSYCNMFVKDQTREAVLEGLIKRHVYGATDNILADVRSQEHMMGDVFASADLPSLHVKLAGTAKFSKVVIIKDNQYVYSTEPHSDKVEFSWRDNAPVKGKTSYYYVRGEQDNGEIVWVSPMWITYTRK
ncbi:MAG: hypothetical protein DMG57_43575 [Acidobacteria bacterium]|nr:MAG: hypothetical protein DMG57_43575 [Acidobacteriota bacterium]